MKSIKELYLNYFNHLYRFDGKKYMLKHLDNARKYRHVDDKRICTNIIYLLDYLEKHGDFT